MKFFTLMIIFQVGLTLAKPSIINGKPVPPGKLENVVLLIKNHNQAFCTGTLITSRLVLTAAHCLKNPLAPADEKAHHLSLYIGQGFDNPFHIPKNTKLYPFDHGHLYPSNTSTQKASQVTDIAVLTLKRPITHIRPVNLVQHLSILKKLTPTKKTLIVGYGARENFITYKNGEAKIDREKQKLYGKKYFAFTSIQKIDYARNFLLIGKYFSHNPQKSGAHAYHGDSGGPAFIKLKKEAPLIQFALAVTPFQKKNSIAYTLPHKFLCWIEKVGETNLQHEFDCQNPKEQMPSQQSGLIIKY